MFVSLLYRLSCTSRTGRFLAYLGPATIAVPVPFKFRAGFNGYGMVYCTPIHDCHVTDRYIRAFSGPETVQRNSFSQLNRSPLVGQSRSYLPLLYVSFSLTALDSYPFGIAGQCARTASVTAADSDASHTVPCREVNVVLQRRTVSMRSFGEGCIS